MIPSAETIIEALKIHPLKVKNVYMYGSRVYGTCHEKSDYDFIVVASSLVESSESRIGDYNIHIHTPDKFRRDLFDFDMHNLECIYAPDFARLQEKVKYDDANFKIKGTALEYKAMSQSFNSFHKAKIKMDSGDTVIAKKSLFHSFRILDYAKQILEVGKIDNFSSVNHIWSNIQTDTSSDWSYYKDKYLDDKIAMENSLKRAVR